MGVNCDVEWLLLIKNRAKWMNDALFVFNQVDDGDDDGMAGWWRGKEDVEKWNEIYFSTMKPMHINIPTYVHILYRLCTVPHRHSLTLINSTRFWQCLIFHCCPQWTNSFCYGSRIMMIVICKL